MIIRKNFFKRISKDFRQKELIPLKISFFVQASTLYVLYPYLTIHMRELGINVEETAIMSSITPLVAMMMPPLAGMLADRIGNFKILLAAFSAFGGLAALLLLLVPIGRMTVHFPERIIMDLGCQNKNDSLSYTMSQTQPCEMKLQSEIPMRLESCGFVCHVEMSNETNQNSIVRSNRYTVKHYNFQSGVNTSYKYTIAQSDLPTIDNQQEDMREHRQLKNNEFFKTSIRQISKTHYFFPTNELYQFSCTSSNHLNDFTNETYTDRTLCAFGHLIKPKDNINQTKIERNYHLYKSKIKSLETNEEDLHEERQRYLTDEISWTGNDFQKLVCDYQDVDNNQITVDLQLYDQTTNPENKKIVSANTCSKRCIITAPRNSMCSNMNMEIEYNVRLTFWLYLVIRVFIGIIGGTTFAMFEGAVIAILREQNADYGLQRIYGVIGGVISSPLSGLLIDYASSGKGYTDFRPAFYLYAVLKLVSGVFMLLINLEFKSPARNVVRDVLTVLRNIETTILFLACFVLGTAWGYIESFLFWLIQDLGGSRSLMGITITVGGIAGIPLLAFSGPIISKIGHANVLFIGFVFYAVRLCGYSLIYNPWHILIFEALESVTTSLSFTAAVTYAAKLSTTSTDSSIQGLLGGVYYGVGKGTGSLIGGYLIKLVGTRPTYQIFAVITLVIGIIYFIFNTLYLKKRSQVEDNDAVKKGVETNNVQNNSEKYTYTCDIRLEERQEDQHIKEKKSKFVGKTAIDNKKSLNELQGKKFPENSNSLSEIKATTQNVGTVEQIPPTDKKLATKIENSYIDDKENNTQQNDLTNPNVEDNDQNQHDNKIDEQQVDEKRINRLNSSN